MDNINLSNLQQIYNYKAYEERNIICYYTLENLDNNILIKDNNNPKEDKSKKGFNLEINKEHLLLIITNNKKEYRLEIIYLSKDFNILKEIELSKIISLSKDIHKINCNSNNKKENNNDNETLLNENRNEDNSLNEENQSYDKLIICYNDDYIENKDVKKRKSFLDNTAFTNSNKINYNISSKTLDIYIKPLENSLKTNTSINEFNNEKYNTIDSLIWVIIKLVSYEKKISSNINSNEFYNKLNINLKNINLKELNSYAIENKIFNINKLFSDKEKSNINSSSLSTLSTKETEILSSVFKELNIKDAITNYSLEVLNSKLDDFSIKTKENFIANIQNNFNKESNLFNEEIIKIEVLLDELKKYLVDNKFTLDNLSFQTQKIEESNHKEEIRFLNMQKLLSLLKDINKSLSPGNEDNLLSSEFKSRSELIIFKEAIKRFTEFYNTIYNNNNYNNKDSDSININNQDTDSINVKVFTNKSYKSLRVVSECENRISNIINSILNNFSKFTRKNMYSYSGEFKEFNLLNNMPKLTNLANACVSNANNTFSNVSSSNGFDYSKFIKQYNKLLNSAKLRKSSLLRFFKERKFFLESLLLIFNSNNDNINLNQTDSHESKSTINTNTISSNLNKNLIFNLNSLIDCELSLSKGLRDIIVKETNNLICIWEAFYECKLFDSNNLNIYLDKDDLINYDYSTNTNNNHKENKHAKINKHTHHLPTDNSSLFNDDIFNQTSSEFGKYIAALFLNLFVGLEISVDSLNYFFEGSKDIDNLYEIPLIQKSKNQLNNSLRENTNNTSNSNLNSYSICKTHNNLFVITIELVTHSILEKVKTYIQESTNKNILMGIVIYCVLISIKSNIQKNILSNMVVVNLNEIIEDSKDDNNNNYLINLNEESIFQHTNNDANDDNNNLSNSKDLCNLSKNVTHNNLDKSNLGKTLKFNSTINTNLNNNIIIKDLANGAGINNKITLQETKDFIEETIRVLEKQINEFLNEQKIMFSNYKIDTRYIGVVPIIKKTLNFLNILVSLTAYIKQDYIFEIVEDFYKLIKKLLEEDLAKAKEKYENIVLAENYYYVYMFFNYLDPENNLDNKKKVVISSQILDKLLKETLELFNYRKQAYILENINYFFNHFIKFYNEYKTIYINAKQNSTLNMLKLQNNYTFDKVDKQVNSFLKDVNKHYKDIAERVHKHFSKEDIITDLMWKDTVYYIKDVISTLSEIYINVYDKKLESGLIDSFFNKLHSIKIHDEFKRHK